MNAKISSEVPRPGSTDAEVDAGEHAGERRRHAADREDERERLPHVDAERRHHRAVLDAGADDQAVARVAQEREQPDEHERGRRDLDEAVVRDARRRRSVVVSIEPRRAPGRLRASSPRSPGRARRARARADGDEHLLDVAGGRAAGSARARRAPRATAPTASPNDRADEQLVPGPPPTCVDVHQVAYAPTVRNAPWAKLSTPIRP